MNSRIVILACAVLCAAGCKATSVSGVTCSSDSDCASGKCDTSSNLCIGAGTNAASGSSGSGTNGSSGTSGTGSSSGSSGTTGFFECDGGCSAAGAYCDTSVGSCKPGYTLNFVSPDDGSWADGGPQTAKVRVKFVGDAGLADPGEVTLEVALGPNAGCTGAGTDMQKGASPGPLSSSWTGGWNAADAGLTGDGPVTLCATALQSDGGVVASGQIQVNVDVTPPELNPALSRDAADMSDPNAEFHPAYARDEDPLAISSNATDNAGSGLRSVTFELQYPDGGAVPGVTLTAGGTPPSASLNLQQPPLGEHGNFRVAISAVDNVGNQAAIETVPVRITRWKWVADSGVGAAMFMPAVSVNSIYAAAAAGSSDSVFMIQGDGGIGWRAQLGASPSLPPALGPLNSNVVFVASQSNSKLNIISTDGRNTQTASLDDGINAMAIGTPTDTAVDTAFVTSGAGSLATLWLVEADATKDSTAFAPPACVSGSVACPSKTSSLDGIYANGDTLYAAYAGHATNGLSVDNPSYVLKLVQYTAGTFLTGDASALNESVTLGFGPSATPSNVYFGAADPGTGSPTALAFVAGGSAQESQIPADLTQPLTTEPLIDANGNAIVATATSSGVNPKLRIYSSTLGNPVSTLVGVTANRGMLLASNHLYAVSGPTVTAVDLPSGATAFGIQEWQIGLASVGGASGAPSLLCGSRGTSQLLVPTEGGQLVSVIIDDQGLDTSAKWPKVRRDLLNSANLATDLGAEACP